MQDLERPGPTSQVGAGGKGIWVDYQDTTIDYLTLPSLSQLEC